MKSTPPVSCGLEGFPFLTLNSWVEGRKFRASLRRSPGGPGWPGEEWFRQRSAALIPPLSWSVAEDRPPAGAGWAGLAGPGPWPSSADPVEASLPARPCSSHHPDQPGAQRPAALQACAELITVPIAAVDEDETCGRPLRGSPTGLAVAHRLGAHAPRPLVSRSSTCGYWLADKGPVVVEWQGAPNGWGRRPERWRGGG